LVQVYLQLPQRHALAAQPEQPLLLLLLQSAPIAAPAAWC
jgi:hypothetical protein